MTLSTHLHFNGQCREAFEFYAKIFGGRIESMTAFAGSPAESMVPAEYRDKILHASMAIGGDVLMGADPPPDRYQAPQGFSVSVQLKGVAEGERIFRARAEGGAIGMPFSKTFWSPGFGMCKDRFGIPWMVNCVD